MKEKLFFCRAGMHKRCPGKAWGNNRETATRAYAGDRVKLWCDCECHDKPRACGEGCDEHP